MDTYAISTYLITNPHFDCIASTCYIVISLCLRGAGRYQIILVTWGNGIDIDNLGVLRREGQTKWHRS